MDLFDKCFKCGEGSEYFSMKIFESKKDGNNTYCDKCFEQVIKTN